MKPNSDVFNTQFLSHPALKKRICQWILNPVEFADTP